MKVYVVIETKGEYSDTSEDVVYAGTDAKKARSFELLNYIKHLTIETWYEGTLISTHYKSHDDKHKWVETWNKVNELNKKRNELLVSLDEVDNDLAIYSSQTD